MGYRVTEAEIEVDFIESLEWASDFPYADYPSSLPRREIRLEVVPSDVIQLLERYIDAYNPDHPDWDTVIDCETKLKDHGYPFTQFGGRQMMWQDIPVARCTNPACGRSRMDVFGVIWNIPVEGVFLWDDDPEYREAADVQIIYQICPSCDAIHVCNRCT